MRKTLIFALGAAVALVGAAVAMAAVFTASGISETTATFTDVKASDVRSRTCTTDTKEFKITRGRYAGALVDFTNPGAPGNDLDGPVTINARTTTSDGLGYVDGSFRVKNDDTRLSGRFTGTLKGTQLVGFLVAGSRGHHATVLGNLSATFDPATGFTDGKIGAGSSTAVLAILAGPVCKGQKDDHKSDRKDDKGHGSGNSTRPVYLKGTVTALGTNPASITVTPQHGEAKTCVIDASSPATLPVSTKVEMKCEWVGTPTAVLTLRKLKSD